MKIAFLGNFSVNYSSESHHAASLESLGHSVVRLQENVIRADQVTAVATTCDLFVWVHTHGWSTSGMSSALTELRHARIPSLTYHLDLWRGLARERDIRSSPYWELDHFWTVDKLMADWLNDNTPVKGHFIAAGVYGADCYLTDGQSPYANDVIFVGSRRYHPEWPWRPRLVDWLARTYGRRFTHIGPDGVASLRGDDLNRLYQRSKVAVGDTLCLGYTYPHYTSDRYFEAPGRGGFQVFPRIPGTDWVDMPRFGFGDFDGLKTLIDHYLDHDEERETMRTAAHEHVKSQHTYRDRWQTILGSL
jgi:hypothetical protein